MGKRGNVKIESFWENELPGIFEKVVMHREATVKYLGLVAMEVFSSSGKLENINFLFQKQEMLGEFTEFLKNEVIQRPENLKVSGEVMGILTEVFENRLKRTGCEFGFFSEYLEQKENRRKIEEIFRNLKTLIQGMKAKNVELMKKNFLALFSGNNESC